MAYRIRRSLQCVFFVMFGCFFHSILLHFALCLLQGQLQHQTVRNKTAAIIKPKHRRRVVGAFQTGFSPHHIAVHRYSSPAVLGVGSRCTTAAAVVCDPQYTAVHENTLGVLVLQLSSPTTTMYVSRGIASCSKLSPTASAYDGVLSSCMPSFQTKLTLQQHPKQQQQQQQQRNIPPTTLALPDLSSMRSNLQAMPTTPRSKS